MSYSVYCASGSNGSVTYRNYGGAGSYLVSAGDSITYNGFTGAARFTANPDSGYSFKRWVYRLNGYDSTQYTSTSNPLDFSESDGSFLVVRAEFESSGSGGGGTTDPDPPSSDTGYYNTTCYNITTGTFITGYDQSSDSTNTFTRPSISGYTYQGYIYHSSYALALEQYNDGGGYDSTGTSVSMTPSLNYTIFFYSGGGGGGGTYHYACYNESTSSYISGYTDISTSSSSITRPELSGYTYNGYVYYDTFAKCISQIATGTYDSTGITCSSHTSNLNHIVFFYSGSGSSETTESVTVPASTKVPFVFRVNSQTTYTFYTEGTSLDTYGYLTDMSVTEPTTSNSIAYNDDGGGTYGTNFAITVTLAAGTYKIWVSGYAGRSGTTTLKITPRVGIFTGAVAASGPNTATITARFSNSDPSFAYLRGIRVKLNGSWATSYIDENDGTGGATSTFSSTLSGLSANTTYTYEIRLYQKASGSYVDANIYVTGSFTTNQIATGLFIYINGQWKDCLPYVYTSSGWVRAYSRMYINGWKGS